MTDMAFDTVPAEMRALPQWTVWRSVIRDGKVAKPPYRSDNPTVYASKTDPTTWGTFERAVACALANPSTVSGIGFMTTRSDPFVCIDMDDAFAQDSQGNPRVAPEMMGYRREFEKQALALGSYAETSPGGNGIHVWILGQPADGARHLTGVGGEVYAWDSFVTVTGRPVSPENSGPVLDGQNWLTTLGLTTKRPAPHTGADPAKPLDLSDEQVLARARAYVGSFSERFDGQVGCEPKEWSHTFVALVGLLDKVTGDAEQIYRLLYYSGMVQNSPPAGTGESRPNKCKRTFGDVLGRVRRGNRSSGYFTEHGRRVWEAIVERRQVEAKRRAEQQRKAQEDLGKLSRNAHSLLGFFSVLGPALGGSDGGDGPGGNPAYPPGTVGDFVRACEGASHAPYTKFAVPATLATLSGISGRQYKTASGGGINLNFILAAPSSTGKTETMKAWQRFLGDALFGLPNTPGGPPKARVISASTSSIQGIMHRFEDTPSCAWFIEECHSQLTAMTNCKTAVEAALRDSYNQLYDCAEHGYAFTPPLSVAARNANTVPIHNLNVSTYWSTTTSKFDVFSDDALDGFLSRVTVIRHNGPAGALQRQRRPLAQDLLERLRYLVARATDMDDAYRSGAAAGGGTGGAALAQAATKIIFADQTLVNDLDWELVTRCEAIKNASLRGELPPTYTAASRLPQTAMRVAVVLALVENPHNVVVQPEQLRWAFGYLLQNLVALLSDMDAGEVGGQQADEHMAVVRGMRALNKGGKYDAGIPRGELYSLLKTYKPFSGDQRVGRARAVTNCLAHMLQEGLIEEHCPANQGRGRPTKYVVPAYGHPIWA